MMQTSSSGIKKAPGKTPKPTKLNSAFSVFVSTVSRCRNPLILYFVAMFIFGPVSLLMSSNTDYAGRLVLDAPLLVLGYLVPAGGSIVIPMVVFSYLDNKRALDVFHALPVTRVKMFTGNFLAGLVMLYAPYLVMTVPVAIAIGFNRYLNNGTYEQYLLACFWAAAVYFFCYVLMTLLVVSCSTLLESVGYFAIILLGYLGLDVLTFELIGGATYGYTKFPIEDFFLRFSPVSFIAFAPSTDSWRTKCAVQLLITGLLLLYFCYRRIRARKSEQIGGGYVWPPLYYIAAIGGSIAAGLVAASVITGVRWILLSIIIGVLFYAILDTIRNRGFKNIVRTGIVSGCTVAGVGVIALLIHMTGTFGYEEWLPKEDEIVSVSISTNRDPETYSLAKDFVLSDPESIHRTLSGHQSILANQKVVKAGTYANSEPLVEYTPYIFDEGDSAYAYGSQYVRITYQLKNGRTVERRYSGVPTTLMKQFTDIAGSQAYSCAIAEKLEGITDYLNSLTSEQMNTLEQHYGSNYELVWIDLAGIQNKNESLNLTGGMQKQLLGALAEDFRRRPEGWKTNPDTQPIGSIYLSVPIVEDVQGILDGQDSTLEWYGYTFMLYESDINTLSALKDWGYYDAQAKELLLGRPDTYYENDISIEATVIPVEYYDILKEDGTANIFHFASSHYGFYTKSVNSSQQDTPVPAAKETVHLSPVPTATVSEERNYRIYIGSPEKGGVDVTDQIVHRVFSLDEIEQLRKLTLQVAISDEPMDVLYLDGNTYLIPEENLEQVKEIVFQAGA